VAVSGAVLASFLIIVLIVRISLKCCRKYSPALLFLAGQRDESHVGNIYAPLPQNNEAKQANKRGQLFNFLWQSFDYLCWTKWSELLCLHYLPRIHSKISTGRKIFLFASLAQKSRFLRSKTDYEIHFFESAFWEVFKKTKMWHQNGRLKKLLSLHSVDKKTWD